MSSESNSYLPPGPSLDSIFNPPGSRPIRTKPVLRQAYDNPSCNRPEGGRPEQAENTAFEGFKSDGESREDYSEASSRALRWRGSAEDRSLLSRPDSGALCCSTGQFIDASDGCQKTRFGPGCVRS